MWSPTSGTCTLISIWGWFHLWRLEGSCFVHYIRESHIIGVEKRREPKSSHRTYSIVLNLYDTFSIPVSLSVGVYKSTSRTPCRLSPGECLILNTMESYGKKESGSGSICLFSLHVIGRYTERASRPRVRFSIQTWLLSKHESRVFKYRSPKKGVSYLYLSAYVRYSSILSKNASNNTHDKVISGK
ncbi:hypothetical protein BDV23DRAFT_16327 [Aspergillus alliaceus]|uniref:Uncharacterized protein n=1 Tax=Petromyces alliaceus TaxID=209559 RepID=A0A5N7BVI5_PETAA|nr:hypothetical protein BDV23DRAFT_16327 [Aspergillus alliaceus]